MIHRKVVAYINIDHLAHNIALIRSKIGKARLCAVAKADAYGHGALPIAHALEEAHVDYIAVAYLEEALELREAGIRSPILILGITDPRNSELLIDNEITQTIYTPDSLLALESAAHRKGKKARIHLKIDTGMHRQGIELENLPAFLEKLSTCRNLEIEGVYSHFAEADNPQRDFTCSQIEKFNQGLAMLARYGINPPLRHLANSAGILNYPEAYYDMVRPGILLYGMSPDGSLRAPDGFKPVMRLAASIATIKTIETGESVSYGRIFTASRRTRVGLLPIGYADGYSRSLSNKAMVVIRDRRIPLIGRVCMDQFMVDLTDAPEVAVGDEATLFGTEDLPAGFLTRLMGTLDYELTCGISKRVPRIVCHGGRCL